MNNMNPNFFCMVDGGIIYQVDTYNKVAIGYTNEVYNNLSATTDEYYSKLVELGVIIPPKTQDEINAELQKALIDSQNLNRQMLEVIQSLKGENTNGQHDSEQREKPIPRSKSGQRNKSGEPGVAGEN